MTDQPRPTPEDEAIVAEQLQFVEWLKLRDAYNQWATADAMRMGHRVWKLANEDLAAVEADLQLHRVAVDKLKADNDRLRELLGEARDILLPDAADLKRRIVEALSSNRG